MALVFVFVSAGLAILTSFTVPQLTDRLDPWELRTSLGIGVFILVQFGILTPMKMWRDAVWVANIEALLESIWDCHDEGVKLLNEHFEDDPETGTQPRFYIEPQRSKWVETWVARRREWTDRSSLRLAVLSQLEARRFKNVVVLGSGLNHPMSLTHAHHLRILLRQLEMLSNVLLRHEPALLPE